MPYIKPEHRAAALVRPEGSGPLCYAICQLIQDYRLRMRPSGQGDSFAVIADILTALEAAKLEFWDRVVAPHEELRRQTNGGVF